MSDNLDKIKLLEHIDAFRRIIEDRDDIEKATIIMEFGHKEVYHPDYPNMIIDVVPDGTSIFTVKVWGGNE